MRHRRVLTALVAILSAACRGTESPPPASTAAPAPVFQAPALGVWIAVSSDGKTAYTAKGPSNEVAVVDLASRRVTATVSVGRGPWGAAFVAR